MVIDAVSVVHIMWFHTSFAITVVQIIEVKGMTKEEALKAWEKMYSEIDKENYLFVGTINPEMVEWAIKALRGEKHG